MKHAYSPEAEGLVGTAGLSYRGPLVAAFSTSAAILAALVWLALWSPIASSISAPATLVMESSRQAIQHTDGGTVELLAMSEGVAVRKGELLLRFDGQQLSIDLANVEESLVMNATRIARLSAEQREATSIFFPVAVHGIVLLGYPNVLDNEIAFFEARRAAMSKRFDAIDNERAEAAQTQVSLHEQLLALRTRQEVATADLSGERALTPEFTSRARVGNLKSIEAAVRGETAAVLIRINENNFRLVRGFNTANQIRAERSEQNTQDMLQTNKERVDIERRLFLLQGQKSRIEIRSPVDGRIINLLVHSPGAIVTPSSVIAEIVPDESPMFVDAQLRPADVVNVTVGTTVRCRLSGKDGHPQQVTAQIISLSADRLIDRERGTPYFSLRAKLNLRSNLHAELRNGMPLDVIINTGEATIADRFARPIISLLEGEPEVVE